MDEREQTHMENKNTVKTTDVFQRSLSAGYWFLLDTLIQRVLVFGTFFITARLLVPADYGIIALAMIYPSLLDGLTAIAFETALTQKKAGEEMPYLNVAWTFNLLRNILLFCVVFLTAPFVAHFFHADNFVLLFQLSGLTLFIQGWSNIGQLLFVKALDFKKLFLRDMAMYGTNSLVSISCALLFHSYWALFAGNAAGILAAAISTQPKAR
jgi:O-antigen/teichoic acid export membrane protein